MEWVASTLHTTSEHGVSSITTADAHSSAASSRLNWRPAADLNGLVRFAERRNVVSARVPSHFKRSLPYLFRATHANFSGSRCLVSGSWHCPHWRGRTVRSTSPSPSSMQTAVLVSPNHDVAVTLVVWLGFTSKTTLAAARFEIHLTVPNVTSNCILVEQHQSTA